MISGIWHKLNGSQNLGFEVYLNDSVPGSLNNRYAVAGIKDDSLIETAARRFQDAVKRGDKATVAAQIHFPIQIHNRGKERNSTVAG
jgi:hypothetical protein